MGRKTISATVAGKVLCFTKHTISGYWLNGSSIPNGGITGFIYFPAGFLNKIYDFFCGIISSAEDYFSIHLLYTPFLYSKTNPDNIYKDIMKSRQGFSMAAEVLYSRLYSGGIKNNT